MNSSQDSQDNIAQERRQVSVFLLTVLQVIINEQVRARLLDSDVGKYIYQAVKDQCRQMGYIQ